MALSWLEVFGKDMVTLFFFPSESRKCEWLNLKHEKIGLEREEQS